MSFISVNNDGRNLDLREAEVKGRITEHVELESVDQSPKSRGRARQLIANKSFISGSTSFAGSGVELEEEIDGLDLIAEEEESQFEKGLFIVSNGRGVVRDPYDGFEVA